MTAHCRIAWAWTNNSGNSWTTGTITPTNGTFAKPEVIYDTSRDRFVLLYINGQDYRIWGAWSPAIGPSWTAPVVLSQPGERFRYMGGAVMDATGTGLVVASTGNPYFGTRPGRLVQMALTGSYSVGWQYWVFDDFYAHITRRHFGIARRASNGRVLLAFRATSSVRAMVVSTKTSISPSVEFPAPTEEIAWMINGVDVAFNGSAAAFTAGLSW